MSKLSANPITKAFIRTTLAAATLALFACGGAKPTPEMPPDDTNATFDAGVEDTTSPTEPTEPEAPEDSEKKAPEGDPEAR